MQRPEERQDRSIQLSDQLQEQQMKASSMSVCRQLVLSEGSRKKPSGHLGIFDYIFNKQEQMTHKMSVFWQVVLWVWWYYKLKKTI